jgi:hypothetical protein
LTELRARDERQIRENSYHSNNDHKRVVLKVMFEVTLCTTR